MNDRIPPRVTAIIIFLNEREHLAEAVTSVVAQSFADWELVLVDDGSSDGSEVIAADLARSMPDKVRLVHHPGRLNRGMSASRNLGIATARGTYVGFLDADDVWCSGKLSAQVAILDSEPEIGLVYGRTLIWHSWRAETGDEDFFYDLGVVADASYAPPILFRLLLANKAQTPTTCNALMRRSLLEAVGGFEDRFRGMFEDQVFFAKALLGARAHVSSEVWAKYRQRPSSHSSLAEGRGVVDSARLIFLLWVEAYAKRSHASPPEVALVATEIRSCRIAIAKSRLSRLGSVGRAILHLARLRKRRVVR